MGLQRPSQSTGWLLVWDGSISATSPAHRRALHRQRAAESLGRQQEAARGRRLPHPPRSERRCAPLRTSALISRQRSTRRFQGRQRDARVGPGYLSRRRSLPADPPAPTRRRWARALRGVTAIAPDPGSTVQHALVRPGDRQSHNGRPVGARLTAHGPADACDRSLTAFGAILRFVSIPNAQRTPRTSNQGSGAGRDVVAEPNPH